VIFVLVFPFVPFVVQNTVYSQYKGSGLEISVSEEVRKMINPEHAILNQAREGESTKVTKSPL